VLPPPKAGHSRPLVAIAAGRAGAEVTDFIVPYGVLKGSGLFEVRAVSAAGGPVQLMRAVRVKADESLAQFDARAPEGADVVIVPAQVDPKDQVLIGWIRAQAAKGATIVSICEGARVVANAGLLDGKRATTHWRALHDLERSQKRTTWVRDRRYVQDGRMISTTGVSASMPVSIALIEAVGGRPAAQKAAACIGVQDWSAAHRTADFRISRLDYARALYFFAAPWTHEVVEAPVANGEDEVALALRADAWTRSFRTRLVVISPGGGAVRSRHGLEILPDDRPRGRYVAPAHPGTAVAQLDAALGDMDRRYGPFAVRLATLGMEYQPHSPVSARPKGLD
jgi:putative intracellular protease/amidase